MARSTETRRGRSPKLAHMDDQGFPEPEARTLTALRYVGGGRWIPGIPASDHEGEYTATEIAALTRDGGLYVIDRGE